ncbi:MAG: type ISP restriction/modification enzyme [Candidatus Sulfotelmatobacter sp.]
MDPSWRREQKYRFLEQNADRSSIDWTEEKVDKSGFWLPVESKDEFADFVPLADKTERSKTGKPSALFGQFSHGVYTGRDSVVYNFNRAVLEDNVQEFIATYNSEVDRWVRAGRPKDVDNFVDYQSLKWTRNTKRDLTNLQFCKFEALRVRVAVYRPFVKSFLYLQDILVDEPGQLNSLIPSDKAANRILWLKVGSEWPSFMLCTDVTPHYLPQGGSQCFPFYTYAEDGTHRRENITDWALEQFRSHYADPSITKWDIFHYIYAVLHHPDYRQRYAANLRRELPRVPFARTTGAEAHKDGTPDAGLKPGSSTGLTTAGSTVEERRFSAASSDKKKNNSTLPKAVAGERSSQATIKNADLEIFRAFVKAGQRLAEIHVHYEQQPEYPLTKVEKAGEKLDYRVTKMKPSKDKTSLIYNQFLTLSGIPPETYEYRLGNRSALEWIIDQYQVSTDKRSGITNDLNRDDDPEYILRLIGQVITVSLETVSIIKALPELGISEISTAIL